MVGFSWSVAFSSKQRGGGNLKQLALPNKPLHILEGIRLGGVSSASEFISFHVDPSSEERGRQRDSPVRMYLPPGRTHGHTRGFLPQVARSKFWSLGNFLFRSRKPSKPLGKKNS